MSEVPHDGLENKKALMEVALGTRPADLYVRNGRLVNVYSGEILEAHDVAVSGRWFAYVGPPTTNMSPATHVIDAESRYLLPGFVDPHAHVDFMANPLSLTPLLLASGTTTVMADPHEVVGGLGLRGLEMMVAMTRDLPLKFYFSVPVATPPMPELEGGPVLTEEEVESFLLRPEMRAISEVTPWMRLLSGDPDLLAKFEIARRHGQRIEGHTTGASYQRLNALVAAGLTSCHEAINAGEARERLRLGLYVMLRHGSIRRDLDSLVDLVVGKSSVDTSRVMLTPDWADPTGIAQHGYMDALVRAAVEREVEPVVAIQMATLNPATYLGLDAQIGGVAPGRLADLLVVDDLREVRPRVVIANGAVVARDGTYLGDRPEVPAEALRLAWLPHRLLPGGLSPADFDVNTSRSDGSVSVPAIHIVDKTITDREDVRLPVEDGHIRLPPDGDVLKVSLLNTELPGFVTAFLTGFGARVGGLASSLAHEPHRPLVVGSQETDMVLALRRMRDIGGGIVLASQGEVISEIPLPIGGLMSLEPVEELAAQTERMNGLLRGMGCSLENPILTISFLTFSTLPWMRVTPEGVWDVKDGRSVWPVSAG